MGFKNSEEVFKYYGDSWSNGFKGIEIWVQPDLKRKGKIRPFKVNKTLKLDDWVLLDGFIDDYKIRTILEFGTGLSTFLFASKGCLITTFETNNEYLGYVRDWINTQEYTGIINYNIWNNAEFPFKDNKYDLCIVDGALPRDPQMEVGLATSRYIFLHDTPRMKTIGRRFGNLELIARTKRGVLRKNNIG